jgi:transcriptional repressor NrdR
MRLRTFFIKGAAPHVRCPYCQSRDSRVTDSRATDVGIRRRRECTWCGERFTTIESVQRATVQVVKRDGRREEFSREKLAAGLRLAFSKRPIGSAEIEALVVEIESRIGSSGRAEVPAAEIGELAMEALRDLDHIAYIRFASVYRAFADLESLAQAVDDLQSGRATGEVDDGSHQLSLLDGDAPDDEHDADEEVVIPALHAVR